MTVDDLKTAIDALPVADRVRLLGEYDAVHSTDLLGAEVSFVNCGSGPRETPCAVIRYVDGSEECIDIIESVKRNAMSIGHPAILTAVYWWEHLVRRELALSPEHLVADHAYAEEAEKNLARIGSALIEGAKARKLSKEESFALFVRTWDLDHPRSNLRLAWELLGEDDVQHCAEYDRLDLLTKRLIKATHVEGRDGNDWDNSAGTISVEQIVEFLKTRLGRKYLRSRRQWKAFRNAFYAEAFNLTQGTVAKYIRGETETVLPKGESYDRFMYPSLKNTFRLYGSEGLPFPTVPCAHRRKRNRGAGI